VIEKLVDRWNPNRYEAFALSSKGLPRGRRFAVLISIAAV
jgi:hypothetical protein